MSRDNRLAGRRAKEAGANFEAIFERASLALKANGLACTRIPDGCRQVGVDRFGRPRLIRAKSPWDWVLTYKSRTALIDTKSKDDKAFGYSNVDHDQAQKLLDHELAGGVAGYIIWLRQAGKVIFVPASLLADSLGETGSFKPGDPKIMTLGDLEIVDGLAKGTVKFGPLFKDPATEAMKEKSREVWRMIHDPSCDIDPETKTWKRSVPEGGELKICHHCLMANYQADNQATVDLKR